MFTINNSSNDFSTLKDFRKAYEHVREGILIRHGHQKGDKVRIIKVIALYQNFNGNWIKITTTKSDMEDRIRMYEGKAVFKLQALV